MARSTVHYADTQTNNSLKKLHNKLRPAGTPVQRVEYIIELLLLRIFEVKLKKDAAFGELRELFNNDINQNKLFYYLKTIDSQQITQELNKNFFPFYGNILSEARRVFKGNLSIKVQDQLVLIQEVFRNSNFTNNVQSGNLEEVISLVSEIDEDRLLNTDLLGDAIESALSETGGTKEIGLFRTPDHIRQFMVGLVEPGIKDTIFDPACGTGGFLFDSFEFVMECITKDGKWPGVKAHTELREWFKQYFINKESSMPTEGDTFNFYRAGISGIEYLGMIRKMAAVNFYIRGLNPHNIRQGDSLDIFDSNLVGSKSIVLANPPFGAERDKEAYPNVWDEFSKESETTILFVKLMLDSLREGGKCAVIVSEGFLTWDQASARTLRKMLLEEANLLGVIGLPQGVFVSKSGQGPKTSILLFEKGKSTKNIWFYQVENDGYSLGTNRIEQKGCQLVEALNFYHNYIKKGLLPPEKENSFVIPVEWIRELDPRLKVKIIREVREKLTLRKNIERKKIFEQFSKLPFDSSEDEKQRIKQFELSWESKIQNEIAKKLDKAYLYSLNARSYKSSLRSTQISEWKKIASKNQQLSIKSIEAKYEELQKVEKINAVKILTQFDLNNSIEADIVREYIESLPRDIIKKNKELCQIEKVIKGGACYPIVKLGNYLIENKNKVRPNKMENINWKVLGVSNEEGIFRNDNLKPEKTNQTYITVKKNEFCYNPYRINVGSIGLNTFDYENQIISGAYIVFGTDEAQLSPLYLQMIFESDRFKGYVSLKANVGNGVRMNFTFEDLGGFLFPLPPVDVQNNITNTYKKLCKMIMGAKMLSDEWEIDSSYFEGKELLNVPLGELIENSSYGTSAKAEYGEGEYRVVRIGNVSYCKFDLSDIKRVDLTKKEFLKYKLKKGDLLIVRSNGNPKLVGKCAVWEEDEEQDYVYASYLIRFRFKQNLVLSKYIMYYLMSEKGKSLLKPKMGGGTNNISATEFKAITVPLPNIQTQKDIINSIDKELKELINIEQFSLRISKRKKKLQNSLFLEEEE